MGVNKIGKLELPFGLKYFVKVDYSAFDPDDWKSEVMQHVNGGVQCLLWDAFRSGADLRDGNHEFIPDGIGDFSNVQYIARCEHHYLRQARWHTICTGLNSIVTMVIWAVELGYDEIVLVGCDGHFTSPREDHFDPEYYRTWDVDYASRNNINLGMAHEMLARECPVSILNATVGGVLDMYPRVELEKLC